MRSGTHQNYLRIRIGKKTYAFRILREFLNEFCSQIQLKKQMPVDYLKNCDQKKSDFKYLQ